MREPDKLDGVSEVSRGSIMEEYSMSYMIHPDCAVLFHLLTNSPLLPPVAVHIGLCYVSLIA